MGFIWLNPDMQSFLFSFTDDRDLVKIVKGILGRINLILEKAPKPSQMHDSVKKMTQEILLRIS